MNTPKRTRPVDYDRHQSFWTIVLVAYSVLLGIGLGNDDARSEVDSWTDWVEVGVWSLIIALLVYRVSRAGEAAKRD